MKKLLILLLALVSFLAFGQQITNAEYFFNEDPGYGLGLSINIAASENIDIDEMVDVNDLAPGMHTLFIRVLDESENWSSVYSQAFFIDTHYGLIPEITQVEYFIDHDPGYGLGESISITAAENIEIDELIDINEFAPGMHALFIRVLDEIGQWSPVYSQAFFIDSHYGLTPEITQVEYFIDDDPGYGNAIPFTEFSNSTNLSALFFANMTNVDPGTHSFSIRVKNDINIWSQNLSQNFELINCDLGVSGIITDQEENPITSGFVVLFQSFGEGSAIGVDTIYLNNGAYEFSSVCPISNYFIKVIPENNTSFLPTYYGDTPYWQEASIVSTEQSSLSNINIIVSSFAEMEVGSSQVKGHIYHAESRGEPVKNVDVVLEFDAADDKANYLPVAYDKSNEAGEWTMGNLPIGNFRIKVEIPGLEMDTTYHVAISSENSIIDGLNFYVDFNSGIFIEHIGLPELDLVSEIQIFPNPSSGSQLWVQSIHPEIDIEELIIYSYAGQNLGLIEGQKSLNLIDIGEFSKGFYLLKIKTNKGVLIQKVIIQ